MVHQSVVPGLNRISPCRQLRHSHCKYTGNECWPALLDKKGGFPAAFSLSVGY